MEPTMQRLWQRQINDFPVKIYLPYLFFYQLPEHELVVLVWSTLMGTVEWNKKEDLVADQALKHLKVYAPLLAK